MNSVLKAAEGFEHHILQESIKRLMELSAQDLTYFNPFMMQLLVDYKILEEDVPDNHTNYPSLFAIGDSVQLDFLQGRIIADCRIDGISFDVTKVYYDVAVKIITHDSIGETVLHRVDSSFVKTYLKKAERTSALAEFVYGNPENRKMKE